MSFDRRTLKVLALHQYKPVLQLKLGMRVVLITNINIDYGLVNGSQGTVIGFEPYNEAMAPMTRAGVDHSQYSVDGAEAGAAGHGINVRGIANHVYRQEQMKAFVTSTNPNVDLPIVEFTNGRTVTIHPDCALTQLGDEAPFSFLSRTQVPLVQGHAITIHKAQGLTLDRVVVDLSSVFMPGMAYVALSRVRSLSGLKCTGSSAGLYKFGANEEVTDFIRNVVWYEG